MFIIQDIKLNFMPYNFMLFKGFNRPKSKFMNLLKIKIESLRIYLDTI